MGELKIFNNPEFGQVRIVEKDGEPWFVGKDVAEILGYSKLDAMYRLVDDDDKLNIDPQTIGNTGFPQNAVILEPNPNVRRMTLINESGLYQAIFNSTLPAAKQFKRWVTSEILPSIRKHGGYVSGQEQMDPQEIMAKAVLVAQSVIDELEKKNSRLTVQNQIMQPKADYFDELVDRNLLTNFRDTAKELKVKEKEFIRFLLNRKYIYRDPKGKLAPTAQYVTEGLFEVKETFNEKTNWSGTQTLITPKGRETFRLLYCHV